MDPKLSNQSTRQKGKLREQIAVDYLLSKATLLCANNTGPEGVRLTVWHRMLTGHWFCGNKVIAGERLSEIL